MLAKIQELEHLSLWQSRLILWRGEWDIGSFCSPVHEQINIVFEKNSVKSLLSILTERIFYVSFQYTCMYSKTSLLIYIKKIIYHYNRHSSFILGGQQLRSLAEYIFIYSGIWGEEGQQQQFLVRATFSSFYRPLGILVLWLLCVFKFPNLEDKTIFFKYGHVRA